MKVSRLRHIRSCKGNQLIKRDNNIPIFFVFLSLIYCKYNILNFCLLMMMNMSHWRLLCLLAHSGVKHILCYVFVLFFFALCTLSYQFLWIVPFWWSLRYFRTSMKQSLCYITCANMWNVCIPLTIVVTHQGRNVSIKGIITHNTTGRPNISITATWYLSICKGCRTRNTYIFDIKSIVKSTLENIMDQHLLSQNLN